MQALERLFEAGREQGMDAVSAFEISRELGSTREGVATNPPGGGVNAGALAAATGRRSAENPRQR